MCEERCLMDFYNHDFVQLQKEFAEVQRRRQIFISML